jgi:hypothetical protein
VTQLLCVSESSSDTLIDSSLGDVGLYSTGDEDESAEDLLGDLSGD